MTNSKNKLYYKNILSMRTIFNISRDFRQNNNNNRRNLIVLFFIEIKLI